MLHSSKKNLRLLPLEALQTICAEQNESKFRHKQIWEWLWKKNVGSFEEMSNLSKPLRDALDADYAIPKLTVYETQQSSDGTIKVGFKTFDGHAIEGVIIPTENRITVCISSQIGCSLSCKFCATGRLERKRNLTFDEIYDQVFILNRISEAELGKKISNIVYMGMGEPLLNYKNVLQSIDLITANEGMAMSPKRITVSTAGVAKMIYQLGEDKVRFNLALSLHAANDKKRSQVMGINDKNDLDSLCEALNHFYAKTNNDITLEYILLNNFNDSLDDAKELHQFYKKIPTHLINIIEYNQVAGISFKKASQEKLDAFIQYLQNKRVNARVRRSRGEDIDAACGQLANKNKTT